MVMRDSVKLITAGWLDKHKSGAEGGGGKNFRSPRMRSRNLISSSIYTIGQKSVNKKLYQVSK